MTDEEAEIADTLAYMAEHPAMFTKAEMAMMMKQAADFIVMLRELVGSRDEVKLEDVEPEGNA